MSRRRRSPVVPRGERRLHVRAQPVADATDPAPPADDAPAVRRRATPRARRDARASRARRSRSRAHAARPAAHAAPQHGALGRRPLGRQLEQHPLPDAGRAEPHRLRRRADGERRPADRPRDDDTRRRSPALSRPARTLRSSASFCSVPHQSPKSARATAVSASRRRSRDTRAPATASAPIPASTAGGGRTQVETAMPPSRPHERGGPAGLEQPHAPCPPFDPEGVHGGNLTASPDPAAARCGPARSRARRRGRRPT